MTDQFREVEAAFGRLKGRFNEGKISQREFIDSLKQLRLKDEEGRFWMIGAQTGKWYYFDGNDWLPSQPPSFEERKAICISCGFENDLEAETCRRCGGRQGAAGEEAVCAVCGAVLEPGSGACPVCERKAATPGDRTVLSAEEAAVPAPGSELVVRGFEPISFFWFFGALGLFAGILLGLVVGVTSYFPGIVAALPGFFAEIQGKLAGGVVFTILGGLVGFAAGGAGGYVAAAVSNGVFSLVGGLKIRAGGRPAPRGERREER
jgi:ribosomal protein L37E